jgi:hypothetical protein
VFSFLFNSWLDLEIGLAGDKVERLVERGTFCRVRANTCSTLRLGFAPGGAHLRVQNQPPSGVIGVRTRKPADRAASCERRHLQAPDLSTFDGRIATGRGDNGYRGLGSGPGELA